MVEENHFDFSDIKQAVNENNLNVFLDTAEIKKTKYNRSLLSKFIIDGYRGNFPYILNGDNIINDGEPVIDKIFYKNSDELAKSIGKMVDKVDENLEVLFSGYMIKYTMVFTEINAQTTVKDLTQLTKV